MYFTESFFTSRLLLIYMVFIVSPANGFWHVSFFDTTDFEGYWNDCTEKDFDGNGQCSLNKDNNYRSIAIRNGTCVELNVEDTNITITDDTKDLGISFKGGHANKCETHNVSLICLNGTFAKEIQWDNKFDLTKGIKLSCYPPEFFETNATVLDSHPGEEFAESDRRKCGAIYGITFKTDYTKDSIVELDLKENCTVGYAKGVRSSCIPNTVLTGLVFEIESETNYVKNVSIICTALPDIAKLCNVADEKQILLSYNGSESITFSIQKKYGVGLTSVMSEEIRNEFKFYSSSGFEISSKIPTISDNFKENLGVSDTTGFNWTDSPDNMWQVEQSTTLKIKTLPGCSTEIFEIVGRCSFMDVRPAECVQVNICDGEVSNETIISIPESLVDSSYKTVQPVNQKEVLNYKAEDVKNNAIEIDAKGDPFTFLTKMLLKNFGWLNKYF